MTNQESQKYATTYEFKLFIIYIPLPPFNQIFTTCKSMFTSMHSMIGYNHHQDEDNESTSEMSNFTTVSQISQFKIQIVLLDGHVHRMNSSLCRTGKQLRRQIHMNISDELTPQLMSLFWGNKRITADMKLKKLGAPKNQPIRIVQKKIPLQNVFGVKVHMDKYDPLNLEIGVAQMSCGHKIGRTSIMKIIRDAIREKKTKVMCPLTMICQEWSFEELQKIAVFTKSEKAEFRTGFDKNIALLKKAQQKSQSSSSVVLKTPKTPKVPSIPTKSSQVPQVPQPTNKIKIIVKILNGEQHSCQANKETTGQQLREFIYLKISDSLHSDAMSLYYEGTKITKSMKLSEINIVVGTQLKIVQHKADITEVANIIADQQGIDQISLEQGVAKMSCGHSIGRDTMTSLVQSLISSNKFQIRCPYPDENDLKCNASWSFKDCRKIGVFTKEESAEFEKGLSMNWMKEFTKECPKCSEKICKIGLKTNRVVCPSCGYGDFCYLCLGKWRTNQEFCGNQQCKFLNDFLSNSPWNRQFQLYDLADGKKLKIFHTPQYRACPVCSLVIEHTDSCKHMTCKSCTSKFCWVCLGVLKNGSWKCGSYNHYCGKVAQAQKFTNF